MTGLNPGTLLKNKLWHGCFPRIFAKLLQKLFYRTPATTSVYEEFDHKSEDCFWSNSGIKYKHMTSGIVKEDGEGLSKV